MYVIKKSKWVISLKDDVGNLCALPFCLVGNIMPTTITNMSVQNGG